MRAVDVDAAVAVARFAADQLLAEAADPDADLSLAERRGLVSIAISVDAQAAVWAGLPPRSPGAQAIVDQALAAVDAEVMRWVGLEPRSTEAQTTVDRADHEDPTEVV